MSSYGGSSAYKSAAQRVAEAGMAGTGGGVKSSLSSNALASHYYPVDAAAGGACSSAAAGVLGGVSNVSPLPARHAAHQTISMPPLSQVWPEP